MKIQEIIKRLNRFWFRNEIAEGFDEIDRVENFLGAPLPADYKYFMQWFSNGGESDQPLEYVLLFTIEEVLQRQQEYELSKWAPRYLVFGLEGDDIFCFDTTNKETSNNYKVVKTSLSSRDRAESELVADNFTDFLHKLLNAAEE